MRIVHLISLPADEEGRTYRSAFALNDASTAEAYMRQNRQAMVSTLPVFDRLDEMPAWYEQQKVEGLIKHLGVEDMELLRKHFRNGG